MKKVLIISYYFNKKELIGSLRLRGLAKYLPYFGWEPTIITINSDDSDTDFRTVETEYLDLMDEWKSKFGFNPEKSVKKTLKVKNKSRKGWIDHLIDAWVEIIAFPDAQKNWYKPAVEAGDEMLRNEHFDAILSSSSPVTCHLIANELKKRHNVPWVADLRDLWTQNHYYNFSRFRTLIEVRLEKKTLALADAITTVSQPWVNSLKTLHKNKKIFEIMNGFDPDEKDYCNNLDSKFTLIYTGNIYYGKMDPEPLFKTLNELINDDNEINKNDLLVEFYGNYGIEKIQLIDLIEKYGLENIIKINDVIPHEDVLKKQCNSQLLLLLDWNDPSEKGVIPGKIFEYLAAKRPIVSIGGHGGVVEDLLKQTNAGSCSHNYGELKSIILDAYCEFKLYGEVKYKGINKELNKFNHLEMTKKFAYVLNDLY